MDDYSASQADKEVKSKRRGVQYKQTHVAKPKEKTIFLKTEAEAN